MQVQQKGKADEELYRYALSKTIQAKDGAGHAVMDAQVPGGLSDAEELARHDQDLRAPAGLVHHPGTLQMLDLYRLMRATNALADQYDYEAYAHRRTGRPAVGGEDRDHRRPREGQGSGDRQRRRRAGSGHEGASRRKVRSPRSRPRRRPPPTASSPRRRPTLSSGRATTPRRRNCTASRSRRAASMPARSIPGSASRSSMGGDKAGAKTAFAAVTGSPSADIAALWATYIDLSA